MPGWRTFAGDIRPKTNSADAEVVQDCWRQAEIPAIGLETKGIIGLDSIQPGVLQLVSLQLRHKADAAPS